MSKPIRLSSMAAARMAVCVFTTTLTSAMFSTQAIADPFDTIGSLSQEDFLVLSENMAAATHYKGVVPAEPLGSLGLDLGVELSSTEIDRDLFDRASDGKYSHDSLLMPRLHVHKGLPLNLDVGAFLSTVPETGVTVIGAEVRYAIIAGGILTPSLALRASYSQIQGITTLDLNNRALELTISKGFLMATPYAGVGIVRSSSRPSTIDNLADETFDQKKAYVGVNLNLLFNVTLEADRTGDYTTYSAKAGIRF